jgi:hypothetical protein
VTDDRSGLEHGADGDAGEDLWTADEQALLEAALDFYSAAGGVIEFTDDKRPHLHLRHTADGFKAIQQAMGALQERVVAAHAAGATPERIAQIARMEQETIDLILQRRDAAPDSETS